MSIYPDAVWLCLVKFEVCGREKKEKLLARINRIWRVLKVALIKFSKRLTLTPRTLNIHKEQNLFLQAETFFKGLLHI